MLSQTQLRHLLRKISLASRSGLAPIIYSLVATLWYFLSFSRYQPSYAFVIVCLPQLDCKLLEGGDYVHLIHHCTPAPIMATMWETPKTYLFSNEQVNFTVDPSSLFCSGYLRIPIPQPLLQRRKECELSLLPSSVTSLPLKHHLPMELHQQC